MAASGIRAVTALDRSDTWQAAQALDAHSRKYAPGARAPPKAHLFVRGMLRCSCGEAMLPRSARDSADVYVCRAHKADSTRCPVPPLKRHVIDARGAVDVRGGRSRRRGDRAHVTAQLDAHAAETGALAARAARELAELDEQAGRVEGTTGAARCPPRPTLGWSPRSARNRWRPRRTRAAFSSGSRRSPRTARARRRSETLTRLAELRAAIAGRITDASPVGDIGALRAALAAVCAEVRVHSIEDGMVALDYIPGDEWRRVGLGLDVAVILPATGVLP